MCLDVEAASHILLKMAVGWLRSWKDARQCVAYLESGLVEALLVGTVRLDRGLRAGILALETWIVAGNAAVLEFEMVSILALGVARAWVRSSACPPALVSSLHARVKACAIWMAVALQE